MRRMPRGRPAGRELNPLELKHLQLLLFGRQRAQLNTRFFEEHIEDFALELIGNGASVRSIADAAGVSPSTVQKWTRDARRRRDASP